MKIIYKFIIPVMFSLIAATHAYGFVIVNNSVQEKSITQTKLRQIYNLRTTKWPDGSIIRVYILNKNHPTHEFFSREHLGIFPYQLQQTIDRAAFVGIPVPIELQTEEEMIEAVARTTGAIGYVHALPHKERVHVLQSK